MNTVILTPLVAFMVTTLTMPHVITVANTKNLGAVPNQRSSHNKITPVFGGIGILAGMLTPILLFGANFSFLNFGLIFLAIGLIFLIGLRDDLIEINPLYKLLGQLVAASMIVSSNMTISSLHGILGVYELPEYVAIPLTIFTILVIVNAFNLIDGINGLSGGISLLVCTTLGIWFYLVGVHTYAVLAASLAGATVAFLRFNITPAKIFMGDSGSLVQGLVISILIIQFLQFHVSHPTHTYAFQGVPAIAISILVFPLFDTLRVFTIRILRGRSPLSPDRHHIHHMLLDAGFSHLQASSILVTVNAFYIGLAMAFQHLGVLILLSLILISSILLTLYLRGMVQKQKANEQITKQFDKIKVTS